MDESMDLLKVLKRSGPLKLMDYRLFKMTASAFDEKLPTLRQYDRAFDVKRVSQSYQTNVIRGNEDPPLQKAEINFNVNNYDFKIGGRGKVQIDQLLRQEIPAILRSAAEVRNGVSRLQTFRGIPEIRKMEMKKLKARPISGNVVKKRPNSVRLSVHDLQ